MSITDPLDPFSEVVDEQRRWRPEWYSWLRSISVDGGGGSSGPLTVNVSTVIGGIDNHVLYDNNGVLGEYNVTGAGNIVMLNDGPTVVNGLNLQSSAVARNLALLNDELLSGTRSLTIRVHDIPRILDLSGNLTIGNSFTTVGTIALTVSGSSNVTLPTSGTLLSSVANAPVSVTTLTPNAVLIGNDGNPIISVGPGSAGQILLGQGAAAPVFASLSGDGALNSSGQLTIQNKAITNIKLADAPANTFKGRLTSLGVPQDLNSAQATSILDIFSGTTNGLVPFPTGVGLKFLRSDISWTTVVNFTVSPTIKGCYPAWADISGAFLDGRGPINVLAYGADPSGNTTPANVTANTTAINNAIAAAAAAQLPLYFPSGTYAVSTLSIVSASTTWVPVVIGDGRRASILLTTSATGNVLEIIHPGGGVQVFSSKCIVRDMGFDSTVARTSGAFLRIQTAVAEVYDCQFLHCMIGIESAVQAGWIMRCGFDEGIPSTDHLNANAEYIRFTAGAAGQIWINEMITSFQTNGGPQAKFGINCGNIGGAIIIRHCSITQVNTAVNIDATSGSVAAPLIMDCIFDNDVVGVLIKASNAANVYLPRIYNTWFGSMQFEGIRFDNEGTGWMVEGIIEGNFMLDIIGSGGACIHLQDIISNVNINNNMLVPNHPSATGILIDNSAGVITGHASQDFSIRGNKIGGDPSAGGMSIGIFIYPSGCDHFIVEGNRVFGNTTAITNNAGTSASKIVTNNITV